METVSRHDAGLYSCIASNIIGEGDRVDIEIDVHCKFLPDDPVLCVPHGPADIIVSPALVLLLPPASLGPG